MATTSNLSSIIRFYAEKQNSPFIDFKEFCAYIKKYAEHHVEEQAELVKYLGDPSSTVSAELQGLEEKHIAAVMTVSNKKMILSITFFSAKYANQYKELLQNETIPFPVITDLPKKFPLAVLPKKAASEYITELIEKDNTKSQLLYSLEFIRELPSLILPACVPAKVLIEASQKKIIKVMKKEEYHDYFLKKLRQTNPTKEITIKNFFSHFIDKSEFDYMDITDGDDYYLWNQLCYYIRQDFEKIQDRTVEDTNVLQAIQITEVYSTYLKQKFQANKKREDALKELQSQLAKPPYFYSQPQILKFQDQSGRLLYGQYSEKDLHDTIQNLTTSGGKNELPALLAFTVASGTKYFIYKTKVIQLTVKLCNEAHDAVETTLVERWYNAMIEYEKLPEMTSPEAFEQCLRDEVETQSPVLHAILNAKFLTALALEKEDDETAQGVQLFSNGDLLPYTELLMLDYKSIYSKAKIRLPLIYTIPIISWIAALLHNKKKDKNKGKAQTKKSVSEMLDEAEEEEKKKSQKKLSKTEALAVQAKELAKDIIPEGSSLDRELNFLVKQWNKMLSKDAYMNLTEDVNALIRDYTRRVCHSLSVQSFTRERVENLAAALVRTPNMQRIHEDKALTEYVVLYMIKLVSNFSRG
ncbi:MAG: hypothetical protein K6A43_04840 [Treponema sp.]|nr:hypothetical protein [Treponema sp.]